MNIDLPLILTVIVGASGAIWLIDSLLFASARSARLTELQKQYPRWNETESADAKLFIESASREAAEPYAERMFVLPAFLLSANAPADANDVLRGLRLTGHFLERRVYGADTSGLPAARERFVEILRTKGVPA